MLDHIDHALALVEGLVARGLLRGHACRQLRKCLLCALLRVVVRLSLLA